MMNGNFGLSALIAFVRFIGLARSAGVEASAPINFVAGQEWPIKSASPTTAKVIIGRVEPWRDKVSVSVSIVDIPIPQGDPGAGGVTQIAHIPFDKTALAASVDSLVTDHVSPAPEFENGYEQWKAAKGGIFTISVEQAIKFMFQTINRGRECLGSE